MKRGAARGREIGLAYGDLETEWRPVRGLVRINCASATIVSIGSAKPKDWVLRVLRFAVPTLNSITPCFIADNLQSSLDFYQSKLGFEIAYKGGGDGVSEDFWAFVRRDGVMISLKAIAPEIHPQPNHSRHEWARWDAYIHTSDPDSLYEEYVGRAVPMHQYLKDTSDGLRAFEVIDNNGYVLCFGRPREL